MKHRLLLEAAGRTNEASTSGAPAGAGPRAPVHTPAAAAVTADGGRAPEMLGPGHQKPETVQPLHAVPPAPGLDCALATDASVSNLTIITYGVSIFSCSTFEGSSLRTDQFPGKAAIQADHRFNHCEFKTTTLYHNFTMRSLPNLIYLKENTDYTIPCITKKKKCAKAKSSKTK